MRCNLDGESALYPAISKSILVAFIVSRPPSGSAHQKNSCDVVSEPCANVGRRCMLFYHVGCGKKVREVISRRDPAFLLYEYCHIMSATSAVCLKERVWTFSGCYEPGGGTDVACQAVWYWKPKCSTTWSLPHAVQPCNKSAFFTTNIKNYFCMFYGRFLISEFFI